MPYRLGDIPILGGCFVHYSTISPAVSIAWVNFVSKSCLHAVKQDREKVQDTADHNEQMKDRVRVPLLFEEIEHKRADGVTHAAEQEKDDRVRMQRGNGRLPRKDDAPSHQEIADGGKFSVRLDVNRIENDAHSGSRPDNAENHPAERGIVLAQRTEADRRVCSRDQEKYRAVIEDLEHLLRCTALRQSVIQTGHCIQNDQRRAIDRTADHAVDVSVDRGEDHAQSQCGHAECTAHDV